MKYLVNDYTAVQFTGFPPSGSMLCPQCDYDLQGLAESHACPECGFEYDSCTRVWRDARQKQRLKRGANVTLSALALVLAGGSMHQFWSGHEHLGILLLLVAAFHCVVVVFLNPPHTIVIAPVGILYRRSLWATRCKPWSKIEDGIIKFDGRQYVVQLLNKNRSRTDAFRLTDLFADREDCERVLQHYIDFDDERRGRIL